MIVVTDVDMVFLVFIYSVHKDNCNYNRKVVSASAALRFQRKVLCLFNWRRLNSLRCFWRWGGWHILSERKALHQVSEPFLHNWTWKPANCFHASDGVGGTRSHTPSTNTWRGRKIVKKKEKKKTKTRDFLHYLDHSCKGSVDRKRRVCSQQEIQ